MKTWKIPVTWECYGMVEVEADTLSKAVEYVREDPDDMPLPNDFDYVDGSFGPSVDDVEEIRCLYNNNQTDLPLAETLKPVPQQDQILEELWAAFADVPMDPETEQMEAPFFIWEAGTPREEIWRWFDERYSKGVAHLLYGDGTDHTADTAQIMFYKQLCEVCDAEHCVYNPHGICLFPLISSRKPRLSDDGCTDFIYKENEVC